MQANDRGALLSICCYSIERVQGVLGKVAATEGSTGAAAFFLAVLDSLQVMAWGTCINSLFEKLNVAVKKEADWHSIRPSLWDQ